MSTWAQASDLARESSKLARKAGVDAANIFDELAVTICEAKERIQWLETENERLQKLGNYIDDSIGH